MKSCVRCGKTENEIRLFDAINREGVISICADCSPFESLPVIMRPTTVQLKEAEKSATVYERLTRAAGLPPNKFRLEKEKTLANTLDRFRKPNPVMHLQPKPLDRRPLNLIDNFHWLIRHSRQKKGYSIIQFAELIGETESIVKMVEEGKLPSDGAGLIAKIEPVLHIKLRRDNSPMLERKFPARAEAGSSQMKEMSLARLQERMKEREQARIAKEESMSGSDIDIIDDI